MKILSIGMEYHFLLLKDILGDCSDITNIQFINKPRLIRELRCHKYQSLICPPNRIGFKIDDDVLHGSSVNVICTPSTGTDHIDEDYCNKNKIELISLKGDKILHRITSTAECAFALMLCLLRNIVPAASAVQKGEWDFEPHIGREVNGLKVGVLGYGRLGSVFSKQCSAFGATIKVCDPYKKSIYENVSINKLFSTSEVVSVHVGLNSNTKNLVNKSVLKFASSIYLINTSRGAIVNENNIIWAFKKGHIKGYATDVLRDELTGIDKSPLLQNKELNILITPHIGGATCEGQEKAYRRIAKLLKKKLTEQK